MLYFAQAVAQVARSNFGLWAKITSVAPDTTAFFSDFVLPSTAAFAQSEQLAVAPQPLFYPLYGASLAFQTRVDGLAPGQALAIQGQRQKIRIRAGVTGVQLVMEHGRGPHARALRHPEPSGAGRLPRRGHAGCARSRRFRRRADARRGEPCAHRRGRGPRRNPRRAHRQRDAAPSVSSASLDGLPADKKDPMVQEIALIATGAAAVTADRRSGPPSRLARNLGYCYDRATVIVNANVAMATQGASTTGSSARVRRPRPTSLHARVIAAHLRQREHAVRRGLDPAGAGQRSALDAGREPVRRGADGSRLQRARERRRFDHSGVRRRRRRRAAAERAEQRARVVPGGPRRRGQRRGGRDLEPDRPPARRDRRHQSRGARAAARTRSRSPMRARTCR